ncbi:DUF2637 domain-containing protein (plasmid) [Streptomyces sp. ETH9427]|uniref:DUF2637 domain-containing protein n=1 Tax=Streptomyces sp. E1N211 TaxID=1851876 RepID=UPI000E0A1D12|nr:DUF2637 domain-containing protein [Streptomyces sp. ETH9427]
MALASPSSAPPRARSLATMNEKELRAAERTLSAGTWTITFGALLYSVLTVTPLVRDVTPDPWDWTAPILPIVVDSAVVIVVRLDSIISRLGGTGGAWPALLRWMTGFMTLALNIADSALHGDKVGVAVHSVAPLLLIVTAETSLAYRRAITKALDDLSSAQAAAAEKARKEREAAEEKARQDREAAEEKDRQERERERARREAAEREERERQERLERERLDREERQQREQREHEARLEQERLDREERQRERERQHLLRLEQERTEREAAERQEKELQERERREALARAAAERVPAAVPARSSAPRKATATVRDVEADEFPGMSADEKEEALYAIYRQARDESTYANFLDDPRFRQGGDLNGSQLGIRLGRTAAAGRTNVKPKFEKRYTDELAARMAGEVAGAERELVPAG